MRCFRIRHIIVTAGLVVFAFLVAACGSRDDAIVVIAPHPAKPNILYIATNEYIYKTRDEGSTWIKLSAGMSHSRVISHRDRSKLSGDRLRGHEGRCRVQKL